jgi:hypothetical protein
MRARKGSRLDRQGTNKWTDLASVALLALGIIGGTQAARGQAMPTASQSSNFSVFAGVTGANTGISGGKNLGITAGADYTIGGFFGFRPAVEVRGTYPIDDGTVDSQKSILAGVRVERPIQRFHPYGDFLIGRGEINYINPPIIATPLPGGGFSYMSYLRTDSTVYSPGAGLEYDLTRHFAVRADGQIQHWDTPVNSSGSAWAKQLTLAVTYRFDFNHHTKRSRQP